MALLNDIGDSVDGAATEVVDGTRRVLKLEKKPPRDLPEAEGEVTEDPAWIEARKAYDEGKLAYELAEYEKAVDKFTASFVAAADIEDENMRAQVQSTLWFNLGQAHLHAYEVDREPQRLGKAKELLEKYLASDPDMPAEDREQAEALIAEAEARLETHEVEGGEEAESIEEKEPSSDEPAG